MEQGVFYGVSVGPGDAELLTVKAVRVLERCGVIAAPRTRSGRTLAWEIAARAVDLSGKTTLFLDFPMEGGEAAHKAACRKAAEAVEAYLREGRDVALVNLGDASIFSTCAPVAALLRGYRTEIIPGVPSFCAAAAALGVSLTEGGALHVVTEASALDLPGTKVFLKAGREFPRLREEITARGLRYALAENCGLPGERLSLSEIPEHAGYFTTVIVRG